MRGDWDPGLAAEGCRGVSGSGPSHAADAGEGAAWTVGGSELAPVTNGRGDEAE